MADRLLFSKTGRAKYISHLDLMRTFQRAFFPLRHPDQAHGGLQSPPLRLHRAASVSGLLQPVRDPGVRAGGGRIL